MSYITRKDTKPMREYFEANWGHVDDVSNAFGVANHGKFYAEMEAWCSFIDALIPDWFPLNYIQDGLIAIVKAVYDKQAATSYYSGVDTGVAIVAKVNDAITWARNRINDAVSDMRIDIDHTIVAPVRQKAAQIEQTLKDAQTKLSNMGVSIDGFQSDINTMKSNILGFDGSIKAFDGKLGSFDSKLKGLDSTATGLQSQLRDAQAKLNTLDSTANTLQSRLKDAETKLNQYKSVIDDLDRRVKTLEGKKTETFPSIPSILNLGV
jgi:hypothetical protein